MTQMSIKSIFALCVVGAVVCQNPAPAPVGYVTPGPGPAPGPASVALVTTTAASPSATTVASPSPTTVASPSPTTVAPVAYDHTVSFVTTLSNINSITSEAALVASLATGISNVSGGSVTVVIQHIKISSTYGGLPSGFATDSVITAYASMTSISTSVVTCNGASYSGGRRLEFIEQGENAVEATARRLTTSAAMEATIANTAGTDVVQAMKNVIGNTSVSAFSSALSAAGVNSSSLSETSPPTAAVSVSSTITGSTSSSIAPANLQTSVNANVPGGAVTATVTVTTTVENTTIAPTVQVTGTAAAPSPSDDSGAFGIVAPAMAIWAAMCAFMMA